MSKTKNNSPREVFEYLIEKNKDLVRNGQSIDPTVFVISEKGGLNIFPLPLKDTDSLDERLELTTKTIKNMKDNKIPFSMIVSIAEYSRTNKKGPGINHVFYASAIDKEHNEGVVALEIVKSEGDQITFEPIIGLERFADLDWEKISLHDTPKQVIAKKRMYDPLMRTALREYTK